MLIERAVDEFILGYFSTRQRSEKTKMAYQTDLSQFKIHLATIGSLERITAETLENWGAELVTRGYASISIRRKFAAIRVFFGYWVRRGVLSHSPLWQVRLDFGREHHLPRCLSASDMKRLVEHAWANLQGSAVNVSPSSNAAFRSYRDLAILEILFATGMRVGELVKLKLEDWNDPEEHFTVKGKGFRQRLALIPDIRSLKVVRGYTNKRSEMKLNNTFLFVNVFGERLATQGVARVLEKFASGAKITVRVTPHMIRHTVATLLLRNGADIRVVQEVLGHSSIATTQRYTHITKEHLRSTLGVHHPNHHMHSLMTNAALK